MGHGVATHSDLTRSGSTRYSLDDGVTVARGGGTTCCVTLDIVPGNKTLLFGFASGTSLGLTVSRE